MVETLEKTLKALRTRISRMAAETLNEENTKATLIEPVLRALGWDVEDVEEVKREYKLRKSEKPVDYALLVGGKAHLLIEAKMLRRDLEDPRWTEQVLNYANVAGVEWCVLTDGNEYRLLNVHAQVEVGEKLFRKCRVDEEGDACLETLGLLAKECMEEVPRSLDVLWREHFHGCLVKSALEQLLASTDSPLLLNYLAKERRSMTAEEIRTALRRCRISVDEPTPPPPSTGSDVSLSDLINAGLLRPPVQLERLYKKKLLRATIETDGRIFFDGQVFDSLSAAGGAARASVVGGEYPPTSGWTFWRIKGNGEQVDVDSVRRKFLESRG